MTALLILNAVFAAAQLGDAAIGLRRTEWTMLAGGLVAAVVHAVTAAAVATS